MRANPFDTHAKDSLLFSLKNANPIYRFFVAKGFNRYQIEWSFGRVIMMILFWKGALLWGGFALLYLLVTWAGTALFYSFLRFHKKYKHVMPEFSFKMSNVFLISIGVSLLVLLFMRFAAFESELVFAIVSALLFIILIPISFFEISTRTGKIQFFVFVGFSFFLLGINLSAPLFLGLLTMFLLLLYAFLFTLNIAFK